MNISELYPTFTIIDEWNRTLQFTRQGETYTRLWLNNPHTLKGSGQSEEVSRHAYALALLAAVEQALDQKRNPYKPGLAKYEPPPDPVLDEWFGPRKDRTK